MTTRTCGDNCPLANKGDSLECDRCKSVIHLKCYNINKTTAKMINESPNLLLLCDSCVVENKMYFEITNDIAEVKKVVDNINRVVSEQAEIPVKMVARNKRPSDDSTPVMTNSVKRRRFQQQVEKQTPVNKIVGTNSANDLRSVEAMKHVVVSQLHPETTEEELVDFVKKKLDTDAEIRAKPLIPKDRNREDLSFITFKLLVPESIYCSVLSPELWPKGITVRDFVPGFKRKQSTGVSLNTN